MKSVKQHKVILAIVLASTLSSGCALLGPLMGMLTGGGGLADSENDLFMTSPDTAAQKLGYRWGTSSNANTKINGADLYGSYPTN